MLFLGNSKLILVGIIFGIASLFGSSFIFSYISFDLLDEKSIVQSTLSLC